MATNTTTAFPSIYSNALSIMDIDAANDVKHTHNPPTDRDDRSSSLSEIGDQADQEQPDNIFHLGSDANDTEAETERLEESPQKQRKHQNIILTSSNGIYDDHQSLLANHVTQDHTVRGDAHTNSNKLERSSDISSLADSGKENGKAISRTPSASKKRKRSSFGDDGSSDPEPDAESYINSAKVFGGKPARSPLILEEDASQGASAEEEQQEAIVDAATPPSDESPQRRSLRPAPAKQKYKKGKRKGKKILDEEFKALPDRVLGTPTPVEHARNDELLSSNGEEVELDDGREVPGQDNVVKTEEGVVQKKTALDSLNSLEKCFATLRDKLYEERLAQCNEELAMLEKPTPTHPDLLNMKEAIEQRRDDKVGYEDILMRFKLQTLQRESVANKSQAHSQYMQTARDVRDRHLNELNKEWYQYQRERRGCEGDVPDYAYTFSAKRSQQIIEQTAYNKEVSLLSGVSKYKGFPAAPLIPKARPTEVEDDFRNMGIAPGVPRTLQNHPPTLKASLSATTSLPRPNVVAEEHSFEQQAWANPLSHPRHPSHQQQRQQMHRQVSALSQATTPSSTPAGQKRVVNLTEPQGSASTIAEPQSGPSSSMAPTPATGEAAKLGQSDQRQAFGDKLTDSTPSKITGGTIEFTPSNSMQRDAAVNQGKVTEPSKIERLYSPALGPLSWEAHNPSALPKPLPFLHTGGSSSTVGNRASTPGRYPVIKAEDSSQLPRHSSMPHQYHAPPAVSTVANGQMNRFAA